MAIQKQVTPERLNERIKAFALKEDYVFRRDNLKRLEQEIQHNIKSQFMEFPYNQYFEGLDYLRGLLPHKGAFQDKGKLEELFTCVIPSFDNPFFSHLWHYGEGYCMVSIEGRSLELPAILLNLDIKEIKGVSYTSLHLEARDMVYEGCAYPETKYRRDSLKLEYTSDLWVFAD